MNYKINIHSHTIFSDGFNSPYTMAMAAKEAGFTALVITDHYYGSAAPGFMSVLGMEYLRRACNEAKEILPIIIGIEIPFMEQEVLVFGMAAIKRILEQNKLPTAEELQTLRKETGCAVILCHPGEGFGITAPYIDGFERYNSGHDLFKNRGFGELEGKPIWCNSDAHQAIDLGESYNIVQKKITRESDLIRYIKSGRQPEFVVRGVRQSD